MLADARYVPIETKSRATFPGTTSSVDLSVRPAIVAFGLGYRFQE
jgi:outer membrane protein W